jgi:hypothetical protein
MDVKEHLLCLRGPIEAAPVHQHESIASADVSFIDGALEKNIDLGGGAGREVGTIIVDCFLPPNQYDPLCVHVIKCCKFGQFQTAQRHLFMRPRNRKTRSRSSEPTGTQSAGRPIAPNAAPNNTMCVCRSVTVAPVAQSMQPLFGI